jgi:hypothetical protein
MKKIILWLLVEGFATALFAQSITLTPSGSSAILELNTTNQALLMPRMTKTERDNIVNARSGMMIFQTTTNTGNPRGMYWYNGSSWVRFADDSDNNWNASGDNLYTLLPGNVGIGVSSPEDRLHVRALGSGVGIMLDAVNPILQLRQSNFPSSGYTDKGFVQLSGDNLRIGLNSSNTNGRFMVRTHGYDQLEFDGSSGAKLFFNYQGANVASISTNSLNNLNINTLGTDDLVNINNELYVNGTQNRVGIGTSSPDEKLEVLGNVKVTGNITLTGTVTKSTNPNGSLLPVCYGKVSFSGTPSSGSGNWTSANPSEGTYTISNASITFESTIVVTLNSSNAQIIASAGCSNGHCSVYLKDAFSNENAFISINQAFYFVIYN